MFIFIFISALLGMPAPTRNDRWERCLSVSLSVCHTRELWQKERKICPDFYTLRKTIWSSFLRRRMVVGATSSTWNFGSTGPRWSEIADFEPIFASSASAVAPSEKSSINTNTQIGSPLRAFQWAQNERRTLSLSLSPKRGLENAINVSKI